MFSTKVDGVSEPDKTLVSFRDNWGANLDRPTNQSAIKVSHLCRTQDQIDDIGALSSLFLPRSLKLSNSRMEELLINEIFTALMWSKPWNGAPSKELTPMPTTKCTLSNCTFLFKERFFVQLNMTYRHLAFLQGVLFHSKPNLKSLSLSLPCCMLFSHWPTYLSPSEQMKIFPGPQSVPFFQWISPQPCLSLSSFTCELELNLKRFDYFRMLQFRLTSPVQLPSLQSIDSILKSLISSSLRNEKVSLNFARASFCFPVERIC